jgi:hypothetical protein
MEVWSRKEQSKKGRGDGKCHISPVHFPLRDTRLLQRDCASMKQLHTQLTGLLLAAAGMTRRGALQHAAEKRRSRRIHRDCTLSHPIALH